MSDSGFPSPTTTFNMTCPECEQFRDSPARYRWCRNEAGDLARTNKWRRGQGLLPWGNARLPPSDHHQFAFTTKLRQCRPQRGPGTEFKALAESLGVTMPPGCNCNAIRIEMDKLGVAGCRRERARLLDGIRSNAAKLSWAESVSAAAAAVTTGLAFTLSPLDPIGSLFDEAVRQAEAEAADSLT